MATEPRPIKIRDAILDALEAIDSVASPSTYWTKPYVTRGPLSFDVANPRTPAVYVHLGTLTVTPVSDGLYDGVLEISITMVTKRGRDSERELWRLWHDVETVVTTDPTITELLPDGIMYLQTFDASVELEGAGDYAVGMAVYTTPYHYTPSSV